MFRYRVVIILPQVLSLKHVFIAPKHVSVMRQAITWENLRYYTICSSSRAYAKDALMSFCFGISIFSSPLVANVIDSSTRFTCHPRCNFVSNEGMPRNDKSGTYLLSKCKELITTRKEQQSRGILEGETIIRSLLAAGDFIPIHTRHININTCIGWNGSLT